MGRKEANIYKKFIVIFAVYIVAAVYLMTLPVNAQSVPVEDFITEEAETSEKALFDANSAMPCVDGESFRRWYESYSASTEPVGSEPEETQPVIYRIAGEEVDPDLQVRLYEHLEEAGIEYWYEGALAQMYQESHCQQYAVNPHNGIDCGLYQYRSTFWTEPSDIFDVDAQLRKYASDMAARFNSGLSVDEAISRHNTSDFVTAINWQYVSDVKQWLPTMERVR